MTAGPDLAAWLLEQIAVDERLAREISGDVDWTAYIEGNGDGWAIEGRDTGDPGCIVGEKPLAEHVANWDPKRVLAECDAKRRLLRQFELRGDSVRATVVPSTGGVWDDLLRLLALPYADRPGYREEWRP